MWLLELIFYGTQFEFLSLKIFELDQIEHVGSVNIDKAFTFLIEQDIITLLQVFQRLQLEQ